MSKLMLMLTDGYLAGSTYGQCIMAYV